MTTDENSSSSAKPLALVTGASSGIGQAFARRLAVRGYDLIVSGRRQDRLDVLADEFPGAKVRTMVGDLASPDGLKALVDICSGEAIDLLVNNAGVAHYMAFVDLPPEKAAELLQVKVVAPTMLARAAAPGMIARGSGAIVNVAGMLAFSGPAPLGPSPGRATYVGALAYAVALSQALHQELAPNGIKVQALCPGIVVTEFHERQGMDLSAFPRMSADDVVTASLRGLELGEVVCAPGLTDAGRLEAVFQADLAAFHGQAPALAERYQET